MIKDIYRRYKQFRPFTEDEAWMLFTIAAIAEAVGWTLLIIGVLCTRLPVPWNGIPVLLAGRTHGMLFLLYVVAVVVLSPSLGWSWYRILIAGVCSVPPYGTLAYEAWSAHYRTWRNLGNLHKTIRYQQILGKSA